MSQNSIKTILTVDDKDVKAKLTQLKQYYQQTFDGWVKATDETKQATQELTLSQERLTKAQYEMAAARQKGNVASKEELKVLREAVAEAKASVTAAAQRVRASDQVASALWKEIGATQKAQQAIKETNAVHEEVNKTLGQQWNQMIRVARWAGTLIGVYYGLSRAWDATLGKGIELGRQIEDMGMGISALTSANTSNVDSNGKVLNSMEKFRIATAMTKDTMAQLRKVAIETPGTFTELSAIFQQAYVSTSKMGKGFGLTLDDVTKNTVQLAGRMANIAGAIGMPMVKALEETRSLMSAQATGDSLIASLLFGSPAQANEAMRKAKEAGPLGVKKLLDEVMGAFDPLAKTETYTKSLNNMVGAYENLVVAVSKPLKDDMQKMFDRMANTLTAQQVQEIADAFSNTYEAIKRAGEAAVVAAGGYVAMKGAMYAIDAYAYAKALYAAANATDALTAATNRNAIAMKAHPAFKIVTAVSVMADAQKQMEAETQGKWRITSASQEKEVTAQLTRELAKLDEMRSKLGTQSKYNPFRVTDEDIAKQKVLVKNLIDSVTAYNVKVKPRTGPTAKPGILVQEQTDANILADALKHIEQTDTKIVENARIRKKELEQIALLERNIATVKGGPSANTAAGLREIAKAQGQIATYRLDISRLDAEDAKSRASTSSKAETAAKKAAREELSQYAVKKQALETELAMYEYIAAQKAANFNLDESRLTDLEKLKLQQFDLEIQQSSDLLDSAMQITDAKNRENQINIVNEKLYKTLTDKEEYRLKLQQNRNTALEKEASALDRIANRQLTSTLKDLALSTKTIGTTTPIERVFGQGKLGQSEADKAIAQARADLYKATFSMTDEKEIARAREQFDNFVRGIETRIAEIPDVSLNVKLEGWDDTSKAFASLANAMFELNKNADTYAVTMAEIAKQQQAAGKGSQKWADLEKRKGAIQAQNVDNTLQGYSDMVGAVADLYGTETKEAKRLHEVQKTLAIAKMAMDMASMLSAGSLAILNQGTGDPYTAFARMAAMAATVASMGIMIKGSFGGGGSTAQSVQQAYAAAHPENMGTGTVLGDRSKQSESITKSLKLMSDLARPEFSLTSQMAASLQSIDNKLGGVSANILKVGGFAVGEGGIYSNTPNAIVAKTNQAIDAFTSFSKKLDLTAKLPGILGSLGGLTGIMNPLANLMRSLASKVFGGGTSIYTIGAGLQFNPQQLQTAMTNLIGNSFQTIFMQTDGGWFGSDSAAMFDITSGLDQYTKTQFQLVLQDLYHVTDMSAQALGESATNMLNQLTVNIGRINLMGKTGAEIQTQLEAIFSSIGDQMARAALPALVPFQKIGEGLFETMTRVASGMEEAGFYIDRLGRQFQDVNYKDIVNKQGNVAVEALYQSIKLFDEATYGLGNGVVQIIDTIDSSAKDLYDTYKLLMSIRGQLTTVGKDSQYLTATMIAGAGGVNELSGALSTYFDNFLTKEEQFAYLTKKLAGEFDALGLSMPQNAAAFKALLESIDISTAAGQDLYGRVITLSDGFSTFSDSLKGIYDPLRSLIQLFSDLSSSLQSTIDTLGGNASGATSRVLIGQFWEKRSEIDTLLAKNGDLTQSEQSRLQNLIGGIGSLSTNIQTATVGSTTAITSSLIGELGNIKSAIDLQNTVLKTVLLNADGTVVDAATEGTLTLLVKALSASGLTISGLPSFDVGSPYLPSDMMANVHKGEMIIDANSSSVLRKYGIPTNDYLAPIMEKVYGKLSEMSEYMRRLDTNIDRVVTGSAIRVVAS